MAALASREDLQDYILRKLGYPVVDVNLDTDQLNDRIDDALQLFFDYHYNGSTRVWLQHQITSQDLTNRYIEVPEYITGVIEILRPTGGGLSSNNIFSYQFQYTQAEAFNLSSTSILNYDSNMRRLSMLDDMFNGDKRIRFEKHTDKIYIDGNWDNFKVGDYLFFNAYRTLDPDTFSDTWNDRWLKKYVVALCRKQWADNLMKFQNVSLMNGVTFNVESMLADAKEEIAKIEEDLQVSGVGVHEMFLG